MRGRLDEVLVGTTLLPSSDDIVRAAAAIARAAGARLHVFHAWTPMAATMIETVPVVLPDERLAVEAQLAAQVERLGLAAPELGSATLAAGPPHRGLMERAVEVDADLIVAGAAETTPGLARFFGSTADRVLRKATRPVLVVRGQPRLPLRRVLFPVDLSPLSADAFTAGLGVVGRLGLAADAELEALFVIDSLAGTRPGDPIAASDLDDYALRQLGGFLRRHGGDRAQRQGASIRPLIVRGTAEEGILDRLQQAPPDLVVLGTHGASGFERLLLGSVAGGVVRRCRVSALVIPPESALAGAIVGEGAAVAAVD